MRPLTVLLLALLLAVAGCTGDRVPGTTLAETPLPSASITETPPPPGRPGVTGLFTDPRPRTPDIRRALDKTKPPVFKPWDGVSTVLYDTLTRTETNLGEGTLGDFSPDSTKMVWTAGPQDWTRGEQEVHLLDLRTMEKRSLGPGRMAGFIDTNHAFVIEPRGSNNAATVDLRTGERQPVARADLPGARGAKPVTTQEGNVLRWTNLEDYPFLRKAFLLADGKTGGTLLEFEAYQAAPAGPGELVVATPPKDGTTNIFIVEIATGQATFVATARYWLPNWPLAADADYVLWTDDYCGYPERGTTKLYNRRTGALTEIEATLWATFTPGGLIASGEFGAKALIDRETLEYLVLIPEVAPNVKSPTGWDVSWSPDYRYATRGASAGHGGLCG